MPQWGVLKQLPSFGQGPFTTFLLLAHQGVGGQHDLRLQLFACLPPLTLSLLMFVSSCLTVIRWPHEAPLNDRRQRAITAWWHQACSNCLPRFSGRKATDSATVTQAAGTTASLSQPVRNSLPHSSIATREIARNEQTHWKAHLGYSATLLIGLCWARGEMHQFEFILFGATFQVFFLILSLLLVLAATSNSFAAERQRQTLDMLLVLPISNRQLVSEKMAASDQIARRVLLPNALLLALRLLMTPLGQRSLSEILLHLLCTSGHLLILLSLTAWITLWFSLRMKTPVLALQGSLTMLLGLCGGPLLLASILIVIAMQRLPWSVSGWYLSSPVLMFMANEVQWLQRSYGVVGSTKLVICSLIIWVLLERFVRWWVRRDLSPLLNRLDGTECIG
jgi:ABC-type transport system involved in multi-copper enzyme maturation permease subunit